MYWNYGQGEDNFIFDYCLQVDFIEFVNFNWFICFWQCFGLFVIFDGVKIICGVDVMGEWFFVMLVFESYCYFCIVSNNGEMLVIDSE